MQLIPADYFRQLQRTEIFPDISRPLEIDLGCGDGTFLMEMAARFPERDFLGVERLLGRVEKVCRKAARAGLANLKVLRLESAYTLGWLLPNSSAQRIHLLFPDPWPKKRHHKNRFITPESAAALHRVLMPGGQFLFKTDHPEYFSAACEVMDAQPIFQRMPWLSPDEFYPLTDFEKQWLAEGKSIQSARWGVHK